MASAHTSSVLPLSAGVEVVFDFEPPDEEPLEDPPETPPPDEYTGGT